MEVQYPSEILEECTATAEASCPSGVPQKPIIVEEIDRPFPQGISGSHEIETETEVELKKDAQKHQHKVEDYKNIVGGIVLAACFVVIVAFAIADAVHGIDSALFSGAFEFAKTIATAVIGYLFAANVKS